MVLGSDVRRINVATIKNSRKNPLSLDQMKEMFPTGLLGIYESRNGLVLASSYKTGANNRYWIDLTSVITESLPPEPPRIKDHSTENHSEWAMEGDHLADLVNHKVYGIQAPFRLYAN
jgi:hypothetical protein